MVLQRARITNALTTRQGRAAYANAAHRVGRERQGWAPLPCLDKPLTQLRALAGCWKQIKGTGAPVRRAGAARYGPALAQLHPTVVFRPGSARALLGPAGGLGDDEVDVAVFRFTLGIPGFEDRLAPRVVGLVGASLLALNHALAVQPIPAAQVSGNVLAVSPFPTYRHT